MDNENAIHLSGPFRINDSLGRTWNARAIRIVDESYGIIDVYVDLDTPMEDDPLHEDPVVIREILSRLRTLGYDGPDFGPAEAGMQDDKLIVLEAPEEFGRFAESKGWKNLAAAYAEEEGGIEPDDSAHDVHARAAFDALMHRLGVK
ncbi:hypothetical protein [Noviherbaspirillum denitrificans]|uniref:Uncharacterized protein n=1 Tax=Noviherbaspirillum denitrificans TaxID=1968433 RepID=A0A254TDB4_9BURK|nr:hypothetical protein [Noviherbaspirillum denitrificans]OWW20157.1 hypothetical protein AYR66_12280 [Noviherbaspirillum denitrificans]